MIRALRVSKRNSTFQVLEALKNNRAKRGELKEIFVEGVAPIKAALAAGRVVRRFLVMEGASLSGWARDLVETHGLAELVALDRDLYQELSDRREASEIMATFELHRLRLTDVAVKEDAIVVVIDRPANHGNLGSIIRSADAFGVDLVVTLGHGVDLFDPVVIRASLGGIFHTPVCHEESTRAFEAWISRAREEHPGTTIIGTDSGAELPLIGGEPFRRPAAVLLGNEARGLSVQLKTVVDRMVRIPMRGAVDSLNVASAASILMYELTRREPGSHPATAAHA